jgi:hypothetical protein
MKFDTSAAQDRVDRVWRLDTEFGMERNTYRIYLHELVSDRYQLVNGLQLLRDELQFARPCKETGDMAACAVDLGVPTVCTTVAVTNCGDRIHQGDITSSYQAVMGTRFATLSEIGELKLESFAPTGGGTDDGATLAHVTAAHQLDDSLRWQLYMGNPQSYVLLMFDLMTHVGRMNHEDGNVEFGLAKESRWREPRAACGAIIGTLKAFNPGNEVHRRIRRDLGEENFEFLSRNKILADDGHDVTAAVAAAIVAIQGMMNTANALTTELDERGVAHLTACTTVNRVSQSDTLLYLARATVFNGHVRWQGLGTDARKYSARMVHHGEDDFRLEMIYDGIEPRDHKYHDTPYPIRYWDAEK